MKIRLNFEKTNLIRLIVAMIFAAVLYYKVTFPVYVLAGFGVSYFLIKSLSVELNNKWLRLALGILMLGGSSVMTAHMVQYLLLDTELRARIMDNKMFLNVLCCLVVYLAVQVFTKNVGLTCVISHIALMTFAGINYFVYLFRGNEFIFSDLRSISTGLSVAGNYEFVLDDRAAYVVLLSALYVPSKDSVACLPARAVVRPSTWLCAMVGISAATSARLETAILPSVSLIFSMISP